MLNATAQSGAPSADLPTWAIALMQSIGSLKSYLYSLPHLILAGDYSATILGLILLYFLLITIQKLSSLFLVTLQKTISLIITFLALLLIYSQFMERYATEGLNMDTFLLGALGIIIAILGTIISSYALFKGTSKAIQTYQQQPQPTAQAPRATVRRAPYVAPQPMEIKLSPAQEEEEQDELDIAHFGNPKSLFSIDSLKNDKSLLSVIIFLVVAEFGVFSSTTISAPTPQIGFLIFVIFLALCFLFIRRSYKDYSKGLTHIGVTLVLGTALAVFLGHYWGNMPFSVLLSGEFFATDSLVALISGMALSLFAGSRS